MIWDDLWLEVTRQSNLAIAGSPRNSFRAGRNFETYGGRALIESKAGLPVLHSVKLRIPYADYCELVDGR
jgi:hypothetical protein